MRDNKGTVKHKFIFTSSLIGLVIAVWCGQIIFGPTYSATTPKKTRSVDLSGITKNSSNDGKKALEIDSVEQHRKTELSSTRPPVKNLKPEVWNLAVLAYNNAKQAGYGERDYLTIVDYTIASTQPRLWVIDMRNGQVLFHTLVAHGIGSGDNYARRFSNQHGSKMSSLGLFLTGNVYSGQYGPSLNLHGLDGKFNSNALARRIVVHQAHYVSEGAIQHLGRLGRSFGCLALNKSVANKIMHTIKGGSLVFCYYPDKAWLNESKMLAKL